MWLLTIVCLYVSPFWKSSKNKSLANDLNILFLKQIMLMVYRALNTVLAQFNVSFFCNNNVIPMFDKNKASEFMKKKKEEE